MAGSVSVIPSNLQLEEARARQNPGTNQNISQGGDLNQNTQSPNIFTQLEHTLDASMKEVEFLAMETIAYSQVPLISSRYTKTITGNAVRDCRKINNLQSRLLALTLLTDQEVSGVVSHISDIFQLSSSAGKIKALEQLGRAWAETFSEINLLHRSSTLSLRKPNQEVMTVVLSFLRRQRGLLEVLEDRTLGQSLFSKMNQNSQADNCFWNYSLETIDGRKKVSNSSWLMNPSTNIHVWKSKKSSFAAPSQSKSSIAPIARYFSPTMKHGPPPPPPSPEPEPQPQPELEALVVPVVRDGPEPGLEKLPHEFDSAEQEKLAVKKINVSSYGFSNVEKKQICECEVHSDGQVNIDIHGIQTSLQPQDLTNVLLCPDAGKPLLFLYLSTIGCTSVLHLLQKIPGVFCSPFTGRAGPHTRRLVICLSSISPHQTQFLSRVFQKALGQQFAQVDSNTYAQLLLLKVADLSKVFGSSNKMADTDTDKPVAFKARDLVLEIIDSVLQDVLTFKSTSDIDIECKEKDEASVNNNNEANEEFENKVSRILRDLQPQPLQARKRAREDDPEDEVRDKKMKSFDEIIDLTSLSPEVPSKNNPKVGMRFKARNNNSSDLMDLSKD